MKYFTDCKTLEDLKKAYHSLARKLHPDVSGYDSDADFKAMFAEYEKMFARLKTIHINSKGETYTKDTNETPEEFADIIETLIKFKDLVIDVCGSWIWVTGNTYNAKETLKALKFEWSGSKKAWYLKPAWSVWTRKASFKSLETIKEVFGDIQFKGEAEEKLAIE